MLAILEFMFRDFVTWLGMMILISVIGTAIAGIVAAWRSGKAK